MPSSVRTASARAGSGIANPPSPAAINARRDSIGGSVIFKFLQSYIEPGARPARGNPMRLRLAILAAMQVFLAAAAQGAELSPDLRVLMEGFQVHRRTAAAYLRTNNADLGAIEIERLQQRWTADREKLLPTTLAD